MVRVKRYQVPGFSGVSARPRGRFTTRPIGWPVSPSGTQPPSGSRRAMPVVKQWAESRASWWSHAMVQGAWMASRRSAHACLPGVGDVMSSSSVPPSTRATPLPSW